MYFHLFSNLRFFNYNFVTFILYLSDIGRVKVGECWALYVRVVPALNNKNQAMIRDTSLFLVHAIQLNTISGTSTQNMYIQKIIITKSDTGVILLILTTRRVVEPVAGANVHNRIDSDSLASVAPVTVTGVKCCPLRKVIHHSFGHCLEWALIYMSSNT